MSKTLLAVDTSHSKGSLILQTPQHQIIKEWESEKSHSEIILIQLKDALAESFCELKNIDEYILNYGPGSFTGLRISLNVIKTLAMSFDKPIFCYNSLEILKSNFDSLHYAAALNAHSGLFYFQNFSNPNILVLTPEAIEKECENQKLSLVTDTPASFKIKTQFTNTDSKQLLKVHLNNPSLPQKWENVLPFYIRKSSPEEKLKT